MTPAYLEAQRFEATKGLIVSSWEANGVFSGESQVLMRAKG